MEFEKIIKTLQQNSRFFNTFSDAEMMQILKHCTSKSYKEGQVVFQERSLGEQMYIVLTGAVRIKKQGKIIDLVRKGECFGEIARSLQVMTDEEIRKVVRTQAEYDRPIGKFFVEKGFLDPDEIARYLRELHLHNRSWAQIKRRHAPATVS